MVIDTSAIVAILLKEPERDAFATAIATASRRLVSTATALETAIVMLARKGPSGVQEFDLLAHAAGFELVPFTAEQLALAREAYEIFGKGRHPARLNFGDCCAYALSRYSAEPLLFKGDDFGQTDIRAAWS